jgi:hypothetical protein
VIAIQLATVVGAIYLCKGARKERVSVIVDFGVIT